MGHLWVRHEATELEIPSQGPSDPTSRIQAKSGSVERSYRPISGGKTMKFRFSGAFSTRNGQRGGIWGAVLEPAISEYLYRVHQTPDLAYERNREASREVTDDFRWILDRLGGPEQDSARLCPQTRSRGLPALYRAAAWVPVHMVNDSGP